MLSTKLKIHSMHQFNFKHFTKFQMINNYLLFYIHYYPIWDPNSTERILRVEF